MISRSDAGAVSFEIAAFSKPATLLTRLGSPIGHRVQDRITDRYVRAVEQAVGAGHWEQRRSGSEIMIL